ncbi:unnamed protein product [Lasius platythorax]|uniref:Uncharacterized protein n=1 Tax=Lasius platythorax TaxID=488582 RepID=A0AAV2MWJ1_9HYME
MKVLKKCPTISIAQLCSRNLRVESVRHADFISLQKKAVVSHAKTLNHSTVCKASKKLKLARIEAQRKEEVLCVLREENTGCENAEWVAENKIDEEDLRSCVDNNRSDIQGADSLPTIQTIAEWLQNPWTTD